jgi:uncharacterized iron-regulated protein
MPVIPLLRPIAAALLSLIAARAAAQDISAQAVVDAAAGADVVVLGEVHDNPYHHRFQDDVLAALAPVAVVFEMLEPHEAARVTLDLAQDRDALAAALSWDESGWPDFAYYYPLFLRTAAGPIYGAEVPRAAAQEAFAIGAAAAFGPSASRFGLDRPLDPDVQAAREAGQLAVHCDALPADLLPGFVEAQRLRDATLASAALAAWEAHGAPVVVITGNGHARTDWGVPALLAIAEPGLRVVALGQVERDGSEAGAADADDAPFDLLQAAPAAERDDPCAAFR